MTTAIHPGFTYWDLIQIFLAIFLFGIFTGSMFATAVLLWWKEKKESNHT